MPHRLEVPHPNQGHVTLEWEEGTLSEKEVQRAFRALIREGWGAAETLPDGTERYTRRFHPRATIIKMIPRFAGG